MIIVKLAGGLGNQFFQYAAGRRAAYTLDTTLKLDLSWYSTNSLRRYCLNHFNIVENIASADDIKIVKKNIINQEYFQFNPGILNLPPDTYLNGYWQSEKYFADIKNIIRQELTPKNEPDSFNRQILDKINSCTSVSIHIRRGDYINNPDTNKVHGVCSLEYYQLSISRILEEIDRPHFFIFSDDPDWVVNHFQLSYPCTFITHNSPEKGYEDFRLMNMCKHNIIANSSFSWWAAWLNPNPDKMVFAPMKWFNKESINTRDLIPEDWHKI